ncbi:MAG: class I mannose-6-phosphate isomerase [Nannocystis sp.]|nr:class I mannose-6-phosphate isomerase [Nannocystis sp.]MBA3544887.1 class I mannose-6-phosphate isomerase [Nannocystis sp.]
MRSPFLLAESGPTTLKPARWGGTRLAALRGADLRRLPELQGQAIGESWEFSTLPGQESRAEGRPLGELLGAPLPFLAKLIDTALPLSVQVHPGDEDAAPGKEEAWIVLAADPGACVWAGLAEDREPAEFQRAVAAGAPLLALLQAIPVVPGSVILVPARTVHAIGGGILLAEIQQPRDCTYRFHDHGSERPIQPEQALATVDLQSRPQLWQPGEAPRVLRGRHLVLEILGPGAHRRDRPATPSLLVPVHGRVDACTHDTHDTHDEHDERRTLEPGALTLARRGPWWLELAPGALCVLGSAAKSDTASVA